MQNQQQEGRRLSNNNLSAVVKYIGLEGRRASSNILSVVVKYLGLVNMRYIPVLNKTTIPICSNTLGAVVKYLGLVDIRSNPGKSLYIYGGAVFFGSPMRILGHRCRLDLQRRRNGINGGQRKGHRRLSGKQLYDTEPEPEERQAPRYTRIVRSAAGKGDLSIETGMDCRPSEANRFFALMVASHGGGPRVGRFGRPDLRSPDLIEVSNLQPQSYRKRCFLFSENVIQLVLARCHDRPELADRDQERGYVYV
ncbi:hypothetical protein J6590_000488 [Homalodisca vitripennis]|nr:hypothetical protein J6590_000488 [Homalodisca vitripennis]